jgi:hypothetical protein
LRADYNWVEILEGASISGSSAAALNDEAIVAQFVQTIDSGRSEGARLEAEDILDAQDPTGVVESNLMAGAGQSLEDLSFVQVVELGSLFKNDETVTA